jgi:hypothetical protein
MTPFLITAWNSSVLRGVLNFGVIWLIEMRGAESAEDM